MKLKILYLILFILIIMPIGLCEKFEDIKELNNTKIYDKTNKIINIYDENKSNIMEIKFISSISDINKFIEIFEITNFKTYIPNEKKDFITKSNIKFGNNIYKIEFYIYKNISNCNEIKINKTIFNNKTKRNETIIINKTFCFNNKSIWIKYNPYNKTIYKNEKQKIKIIYYKKPELGFFKIQTIPIFRNIECKELTWWLGNWNLKRPILINNTYGDNVTNYQLKSVNLSQYQINASSARIINETSGLQENFWNELIDSNGNLKYVWCNFSKILNNTWINNTYYIYYQSNPNVNTISNGDLTFLFFDDFNNGNYDNWSVISGSFLAINNYLNANGVTTNLITVNSPINNPTKQIICSKVYVNINGAAGGVILGYQDSNNFYHLRIVDNSNELQLYKWLDGNANKLAYSSTTININTWYIIELFWLSTSSLYSKLYDINGNILTTISESATGENWNIGNYGIRGYGTSVFFDDIYVRKYTINEPELWTVGNIEYPEGLDMTCNLKIITHLTDKKVQIVDMNASIVNESYTNECINLSYDSYIVYMSNPVKISSFTGLLNILDNFLIQALLFIFLIVIATLFYVFIQIVKKKGFKL